MNEKWTYFCLLIWFLTPYRFRHLVCYLFPILEVMSILLIMGWIEKGKICKFYLAVPTSTIVSPFASVLIFISYKMNSRFKNTKLKAYLSCIGLAIAVVIMLIFLIATVNWIFVLLLASLRWSWMGIFKHFWLWLVLLPRTVCEIRRYFGASRPFTATVVDCS